MADTDTAPISLEDAVGLLTAVDAPEEDAPAAKADENLPESDEGEGEGSETDPIAEDDDEGEAEPEAEEAPAIEPPASWTAEEKERFKALPPETQKYLAERESSREKFVSQKANEYALAARKAAEVEAQYAQTINQMAEYLNAVVADEFAGIDWTALAQSDPAEYVAKRAAWEARQQQLADVHTEQQRVAQSQHAQQQQAAAQYISEQKSKLMDVLPDFRDPVKARAKAAEIKGYLKESGFSDPEIANLTDHRHVVILQKAMRFDAAQKAKAQKVVSHVPQVQKPGVKVSKGEVAKAGRDALVRRAEQTGDLRDWANLLRR